MCLWRHVCVYDIMCHVQLNRAPVDPTLHHHAVRVLPSNYPTSQYAPVSPGVRYAGGGLSGGRVFGHGPQLAASSFEQASYYGKLTAASDLLANYRHPHLNLPLRTPLCCRFCLQLLRACLDGWVIGALTRGAWQDKDRA